MRDPANAQLVNSDPELQQWVRNIKMSAEDFRSKMRNTAAPIFAKQVGLVAANTHPGGWAAWRKCQQQQLHGAALLHCKQAVLGRSLTLSFVC